jgi:hypothetical protein
MMGRALVILGWLATIGLVGTGALGYQVGQQGGVGWHLLVALFSSLLALFSHSWILFYLIGTGKAVKSAAHLHGLGNGPGAVIRELKQRSSSWLMLAMAAVMTTFIVGGGVATGVVPRWMHALLFYATLAIQIRTLVVEAAVVADNEQLMQAVDRELRSEDPGSPSA